MSETMVFTHFMSEEYCTPSQSGSRLMLKAFILFHVSTSLSLFSFSFLAKLGKIITNIEKL